MSEASQFGALLSRKLAGICEISPSQESELYRHYRLFTRWNRVINLSSIRDLERAVVRHYCESLLLGTFLPKQSQSVADLGSGAGFPGIPMAIIRPDCRFTLIESHARKAAFLKEATRSYANVAVASKRAEDTSGPFDWLVSRAVRAENVLQFVPRLAPGVGLLLSENDLHNLLKIKTIEWKTTYRLPWDKTKVLLLGQYVPRET